MAFDAKSVTTNDWGVMGAAAGVFLFSLFNSYATLSYNGDDEFLDDVGGGGINAWDSYAVLGLLLLLAVGALAAARVFADVTLPDIGVGWNLVAAGAAALGTLLVVLRAFTYDGGGFFDVGPGWSGYLVMILAVVETAFAVLAFRTSGEQAPWQQRGSATAPPPAAGAPPPAAPPPAAPPPSTGPPAAPPPSTGPPAAPPPAPPPTTGPPAAPPPG